MDPAGSQGCIDPEDVVGSLGTALEVDPMHFESKFILLPLLWKVPAWSCLKLTNYTEAWAPGFVSLRL